MPELFRHVKRYRKGVLLAPLAWSLPADLAVDGIGGDVLAW